MALLYTPAELKADREIVLAAVQKDGFALRHASAELLKNEEFWVSLFSKFSENTHQIKVLFNHIPIHLINTEAFLFKLSILSPLVNSELTQALNRTHSHMLSRLNTYKTKQFKLLLSHSTRTDKL